MINGKALIFVAKQNPIKLPNNKDLKQIVPICFMRSVCTN